MKERIGELDALRGFCILFMIVIHLIFDLTVLKGYTFPVPKILILLGSYGHILFLLLSGVCVTLGRHCRQRGLIVLGAGLLVSYATLFGELILGMEEIRIWFGILHLLGVSMLLYPLFEKLHPSLLAVVGTVIILVGKWFESLTVPASFLFPLGLCGEGIYTGSDFFPIFPNLGWFLLGAVIGKTLYKEKRSLFPVVSFEKGILRFLCLCGRNSLVIYLLHQPALLLILSFL